MSVLIEALCLVVPNRVLDISYPGGASAFIDELSMREDIRYVVTDGALTAASLFEPDVGGVLADQLADHGIVGVQDRQAIEFVFADMEMGTTIPCDWLETARHPHGFMIAWAIPGDRGDTAVPGDWDPSFSWGLEREDFRDMPERHMVLANENGYVTLLDLETGRLDEAPDVPSPVVAVGRSTPKAPEGWTLVNGLSPSLQAVQDVLQRVGIPFHVDQELGAIRIAFACDVTVPDADGQKVSREIRQRVLVTDGPDAYGVTCTTVLPLCVPSRLRAEATEIGSVVNMLCERLSMEFECLTGTVAIRTITSGAVTPLSAAAAERVVAAASPVAGSCFEELAAWLQGNVVAELTALNVSAHEPIAGPEAVTPPLF